jgi:alkanesulfonate monooxygenase SsuD/methylene tetrahydromethanopterin reductase-like flavin-dependent oxidoreductase (luciferase family)
MLWARERSSFSGRYCELADAVCEPKPVQPGGPPITVGGTGERLTLRVVAEHADRWNFNGRSVDEFRRLTEVLDRHCAAVGREPSSIERSVQLHLTADLGEVPELAAAYLEAGAQHIVLNPRIPLRPGMAEQLTRRVIEPLRAAIG